MPHLALVTHRQPDPAKAERLLLDPLARRGIDAEIVIWDDATNDWLSFDSILIRSTWDYHQRLSEYRAWLQFLSSKGKHFINHLDLLRWNMDKTYLNQLSQVGIRTPDTVFIRRQETVDLTLLLEGKGWQSAVIKPTISAGGDDTYLVHYDDIGEFQEQFDSLIARRNLMVQAYLPEIKRGEISFIYFNGLFSHSVIKHPPDNSIFVHQERGGIMQRYHPAPQLIAQASASIRAIHHITKHLPVYARVDGIVRDGALFIMEVELIEPELFLAVEADAAERFADAITLAAVHHK
jgi:glutathione synthase/RimK-type ligase-like ATP-grasp enzyme